MKESDNKKYFVKDVSLYSTDEDMFNYSDIAEVLNKIIVTNSPPYNVAVIGKWGLGKSSLINLVTGKYRKKNNQNQYLVQEINAWKYEKESLRKVFLKQLWQGISEQKVQSFEVIKKELSNIINADVASMPENRKEGRTKKFLVTVGVISAFTIVIFAIYKIIQAFVLNISVWNLDFWLRAFLSYCKNIGTILFVPVIVALLKLLLDDYHAKQTKKIELSFPIETTDDYEIFLETKIRERLAEYPELKIITVIDDLDRLSIDKIVEALDALKAFVGFERCIFIVPFDDEIIKQALNKRRAKFFNDQADVIESELILDKLFQFKIYLPPILEFDIHQYAFALLKQETPDFLRDYCNESIMKKVIDRVLIHQSVTTPRQVKKLLNAFINNYMIVSARESSGKIEKGLLTSEDSIMQIAKISVLQADFNSFYDLLFKDMSCIDTILWAHEGKRDVSSLPAYLGDYFEKKTLKTGEEIYLLKSENESLVNFLIKTEKYRVSSIAPFLYLAQDGMSIMFGDELQRRAVNALKSGNIKTVEALFDETENIAKILEYHLYMENDSIEEILKVAIAVFDKIQEQYRNPIAQNIINRTLELRQNEKKALYGVSAANAFLIASYGENKVFNSEFIDIYIEILSNEHWLNKEVLLNELKIILEHYSELDQSTKNTLKKVTELCMAWDNDINASDLFDCVEVAEDGFVFLWGVSWYEILCEYIDTENDFSSEIIWHLKNALAQLKESVELDTLIPSLLKLLGYSELLVVIAEILDLSVEQVGGISIKKTISKDKATKIAEEVIKHDIEEYGEQISRILLELPYQIDEGNSGVFDDFTQNCIQTDVFDETLVYCGENQYYRFLPKTISELIKAAVADDTNDILLAKSIVYFTNEQKNELISKISASSKYTSNRNYERIIKIFAIVSSCGSYSDLLQNVVKTVLIPQFNSYYNHLTYYEFISNVMGIMKECLDVETIDAYVKALLSRFSSNRKMFLIAVNQIPEKMSANIFKSVFDKIVAEVQQAEFEMALDVIVNHENLRPKDNEYVKCYQKFLLKFLRNTTELDRVLYIFSNSSKDELGIELSKLVETALQNAKCNTILLGDVVGQFLNNDESSASVVNNILAISDIENSSLILVHSIKKIENYKCEYLFAELADSIKLPRTSVSLINLVKMSCEYLQIKDARMLVIKCLEVTFEQVNMSEDSIKIIRIINNYGNMFKDSKTELADVLRAGFVKTTSKKLKESILNLVSSIKMKPQFKKTLQGEDLEYYQKWIH